MDYESGGSLATLLLKERLLTERTVQFYTAEITLALEFLHKHGILHR
jgi:serine/threonine protein kinase